VHGASLAASCVFSSHLLIGARPIERGHRRVQQGHVHGLGEVEQAGRGTAIGRGGGGHVKEREEEKSEGGQEKAESEAETGDPKQKDKTKKTALLPPDATPPTLPCDLARRGRPGVGGAGGLGVVCLPRQRAAPGGAGVGRWAARRGGGGRAATTAPQPAFQWLGVWAGGAFFFFAASFPFSISLSLFLAGGEREREREILFPAQYARRTRGRGLLRAGKDGGVPHPLHTPSRLASLDLSPSLTP